MQLLRETKSSENNVRRIIYITKREFGDPKKIDPEIKKIGHLVNTIWIYLVS